MEHEHCSPVERGRGDPTSSDSLSLTRRDVVKGAVALTALGAAPLLTDRDAAAAAVSPEPTEHGPRRSDRQRVAIIGAGAGGVAAAYFLGDRLDVDLFEARPRIGGHCDSRAINYQGTRLTVDLGAQFFHPDTHPIYVTLLEHLGLYDPAHPNRDRTLEAPAGLCVFRTGGGPTVFTSANPLATPQRAIAFVRFTQLARHAVLSGLPWRITVEAWVRRLPIDQTFKTEVLYPWITALIGSSRADALRASARSILQTFALAFPASVAHGATTYNSTIGLQGNLQRMLSRTRATRVHLGSPVRALRRDCTGWFVQTPSGTRGPYRYVVLNAPPHAGRRLLRAQPGFERAVALLGRYEYFDSRILIHTDPTYVQRGRGDWAAYNAGIDGRQCEGSVWYGALHHPLPSGATIDVFKSWAQRRRADPRRILLQRRFKHPLISQATISAARSLRPLQGHDGLYFSGQYTTGFDSQESAVYSGLKVAESLTPRSRTLASLKRLLAARGLAGISYDL